MKFIKHLTLIFSLLFSTSLIYGQNACENIITITVEKLPVLLKNNQYEEINNKLNTIEATCGLSEFTLRTRIIYQIINKENTKESRQKYLNNRFDQVLITRWDDSYLSDHQEIYLAYKKKYEYIPMRHAVDSLLKIKATSILNSPTYTHITKEEEALLYLFADNIETYLNMSEPKSVPDKRMRERIEVEQHKEKNTFGVHLGSFIPIGENNHFGKSFTGGLSFMSPFIDDFVFDAHYKLRIHSKAPAFDFTYKDEIREVASNSSHVLAVGVGYKLLDKNRFIILPKLNLGYGIIWTGLSETVYGEDDEGNETETRLPRNVQTLHSTLGIAIMRHFANKTYIGIESNLHLIPYKWDSRLKSSIPSKYASFEFFVRF